MITASYCALKKLRACWQVLVPFHFCPSFGDVAGGSLRCVCVSRWVPHRGKVLPHLWAHNLNQHCRAGRGVTALSTGRYRIMHGIQYLLIEGLRAWHKTDCKIPAHCTIDRNSVYPCRDPIEASWPSQYRSASMLSAVSLKQEPQGTGRLTRYITETYRINYRLHLQTSIWLIKQIWIFYFYF